MLPKLAGIRQPGMRKAGTATGGGTGGGSSAASAITLVDAGGYYASGDVEGGLQEVGVSLGSLTGSTAAAAAAAAAAQLSATAAGTAAAAAQTDATSALGSAALRPLTTDLASRVNGKGASTIALEDAGALYATKNVEAALQQLGPLLTGTFPTQALGAKLSYLVDDNTTTTAPDLFVLGHTTSGTAAAGFGGLLAVELESAGGTKRRAMTDVTAWTTATNASETATRTIQTMVGGAPATMLVLGDGGANYSAANFTASGTSTKPTISLGPASNKTGISGDSSGFLYLICVGNNGLTVSASQLSTTFPIATTFNGTNSNAAFGQSGGSGMFFSGLGLACNLSTAGQTALTLTGWASGNFTASTETVGADFAARTRTWNTGALTTQREILARAPTYAFAAASTITTAATLAVTAAPIAGANATITTAYAFWVQAGSTRLDGNFGFQKAPVAQQSTTGTNTGFTAGAGTAVNDQSTFTGGTGATAYRMSDVVLALKNYGLLAA